MPLKKSKSIRPTLLFLALLALFLIPKGLTALTTNLISGRGEWQKPMQPSLAGGDLTCLISHPLDPSKFLVASQRQVFEGGQENPWKEIWSQPDPQAPIQRLFAFPLLPDYVFALTPQKVFMGNLKDRSWKPVYQDSDKCPLSFALHPQDPNHWFLGTQKGLWETENAGKTWFPSRIFATSRPVFLLKFSRARLFLADDAALYLSRPEDPTLSVLELPKTEAEIPEEEPSPETPDENRSFMPKINDLIEARDDPSKFFLGTQSGAFETSDGGLTWKLLPKSGLESTLIRQLAYSEKERCLYAATPRGIYLYDTRAQCWKKLFKGLAKDRSQALAILNEEKLIAITEDGFVQYPFPPLRPESEPPFSIYQPAPKTLELFRELVAKEPAARELQRKVIRYANVTNGKINRWHAASRAAGLLPTFSFGRDFSSANNIDLDRGGTNDPDRFIAGPSDTSKGWDARVSWDLGDAVYSSDHTSIDSREKMMVELRNDLLSEATRIYYERRRLQIDIVFMPSASEQEHLERLLRLDELTTLLDGMTDGFFSKKLEGIYNEKPEFNRLWAYQTNKEG